MTPEIYWLTTIHQGRLAIMPRPRGGEWLEDELRGWTQAGVEVVVSLLTPAEVSELNVGDEAALCTRMGLHFVSYPIPDRQTPASSTNTIPLIKDIDTWLKSGKAVAIHCRMGIGRSAMLAACVMGLNGIAVKNAFEIIGRVRGLSVPDTDEQQAWTIRLVKQMTI